MATIMLKAVNLNSELIRKIILEEVRYGTELFSIGYGYVTTLKKRFLFYLSLTGKPKT
jgi:hypothetical protein